VTLSEHKKLIGSILLMITLAFSAVSGSFGLQSSSAISAAGIISYWPRVNVTVNINNLIGVNNLSLGFMLDWQWKGFCDYAIRRQLAQDANFKLIRLFDWRYQPGASPDPCIYWNETTRTGIFDWRDVDLLVDRIFEIGAEPLICLGRYSPSHTEYYPKGMAVNPATDLPYPESFAAYAREWVKHFKETGKLVRFYEIFNEPFSYFGWSVDYVKLGYFKDLFNVCARAMRAENPNVMISFDFTTAKKVLDYWVIYGEDIDYLDAHKYDCNSIPGFDDAEVFKRAEERRFLSDSTFYGFNDAQRIWLNARGKLLPTVISESNINSAYGEAGTDPRMVQIIGAVRTALVLRVGILTGLNYHLYYEFSNSASQASGGGYGFGMINSDNNKPWYPYYAQKLVGQNLALNDPILEVSSSSEDVRVLAWRNNMKINILLICKVNETRVVNLRGITGQLTLHWIDNTIPFTEAAIQNKTINTEEALQLRGYTVMLLQANV